MVYDSTCRYYRIRHGVAFEILAICNVYNAYISGPHASARATVEAVVRAMQPLPGQQEEPALARAVQHHATVHLVAILVAVVGSTRPNSCGVRPHALTDWRLKPAPWTTRPNCHAA